MPDKEYAKARVRIRKTGNSWDGKVIQENELQMERELGTGNERGC